MNSGSGTSTAAHLATAADAGAPEKSSAPPKVARDCDNDDDRTPQDIERPTVAPDDTTAAAVVEESAEAALKAEEDEEPAAQIAAEPEEDKTPPNVEAQDAKPSADDATNPIPADGGGDLVATLRREKELRAESERRMEELAKVRG